MHYLNISFRNEIESKRNEFHEKLVKDIRDDLCYTLSIQIHKEFIQYCNRFAALYEPHMSFNPNDSSDPRNMIRICPHCGLIWFKTEGCDGVTYCGTKGGKFDNQKQKAYNFVKHVFKYEKGKLECITNPVPAPAPHGQRLDSIINPVPAPAPHDQRLDLIINRHINYVKFKIFNILKVILKLFTN